MLDIVIWQMLQYDEMAQGYNAHTHTFTGLKRRQTNCCSICCFRCHLFLCVYLACCHVELPRAVKPSSSSGSGGRVERPLCSPVTQHSREQPARSDQGQSMAEMGDPVGTCPEHSPRPGHEPLLSLPSLQTYIPEDESQKLLHHFNYDGLRIRLYLCCCFFFHQENEMPKIATKHCYLSKAPLLVQYHLCVFSSVRIVQILDTLILYV